MPRRKEGPVLLKQTCYYYFDEYIGFGPDKKRIRLSLKTKDPLKARFLWEQEYRRQWAKYYGIEDSAMPAPVSFYEIADQLKQSIQGSK